MVQDLIEIHPPRHIKETVVEFDPSGIEDLIASLPPLQRSIATDLYLASRFDVPAEYCIEIGGTILAVHTNEGAKPGLGILDLLAESHKGRFVQQRQGERPRLILPREDSPNYFGPRVDSSKLQPEDFVKIAEICYRLMFDDRVDRITIITGTDTAEYLGAALARMLSHPIKPIVVIGSMRKLEDEDTDVKSNYFDGRFVAAHSDPGIFVYLDKDTHDAKRVSKEHSSSIDAFDSLGAEPVATFRHDAHPIINLGLNYMSREELLLCYELVRNLEEAWQWCKRTGLPHEKYRVNFHLVADEDKEKVFAEIRANPHFAIPHYQKYGMVPSEHELKRPPQPILDTRFDNLAYYERMTAAYRAEWLRDLLQREDVHGLILDGLTEVDPTQWDDLLAIIAEHADSKPIITMQDPEWSDSKEAARFHRQAKYMGAIPSEGFTVAYGSFVMKWLLAKDLSIDVLREAWKYMEYVGGPGYVPLEPKEKPLNPNSQIASGVRYIHLIPGYEPAWLEHIYTHPDTQAVVLGAFGTGNPPMDCKRDSLPTISRYSCSVPTIIRTQCTGLTRDDNGGETLLDEYEPGAAVKKLNILSAGRRSLPETIREADFILRTKRDFWASWSN